MWKYNTVASSELAGFTIAKTIGDKIRSLNGFVLLEIKRFCPTICEGKIIKENFKRVGYGGSTRINEYILFNAESFENLGFDPNMSYLALREDLILAFLN